MKIQDRVFVITGACGGMGQVLCGELARQGARLAICSRHRDKVEAQCRELEEKYGAQVMGTALDVAKEEEVEAFLNEAVRKFGALHALINLAGLSIPGKIEDTQEDVYDTLMDVNVKGTFLFSKHFARCAQEDAMIINLGSMAARRTNANAPLYCMAKAAVNVLSEGLALQLAEKNIRVTTLNPGGADTPFWGERPVKREKLLTAEDGVEVMMFVLETDSRVAIRSIDFESRLML